MQFTSNAAERGVRERGFDLEVAGERVPGILWAPEGASGARPLVLACHGGSQEKRTPNVLALARSLVRHLGYAVVSLDAPDHGDRTTPEAATDRRAAIEQRMAGGVQERTAEQMREASERSRQAIPEWQAAIEAAQALEGVGDGPLGYWGLSMGTSIGVPLLAAESRVRCAVLGLNGLRDGQEEFGADARSIAIPLCFVFQWDDELVSRDAGIALFEAFASKEKTMHINPGGHVDVPAFELNAWERFFLRHLDRATG